MFYTTISLLHRRCYLGSHATLLPFAWRANSCEGVKGEISSRAYFICIRTIDQFKCVFFLFCDIDWLDGQALSQGWRQCQRSISGLLMLWSMLNDNWSMILNHLLGPCIEQYACCDVLFPNCPSRDPQWWYQIQGLCPVWCPPVINQ